MMPRYKIPSGALKSTTSKIFKPKKVVMAITAKVFLDKWYHLAKSSAAKKKSNALEVLMKLEDENAVVQLSPGAIKNRIVGKISDETVLSQGVITALEQSNSFFGQ